MKVTVPYNYKHRNHPYLVYFHARGIAKLDSWGYCIISPKIWARIAPYYEDYQIPIFGYPDS